MKFSLYKGFGRAITVLIVSLIVFILVYLTDNADKISNLATLDIYSREKNAPIIERLIKYDKLPPKTTNIQNAETSVVVDSQKSLDPTPPTKFVHLSFFLNSPLIGNISIPENWNSRLRAEENNRTFDLVYSSSSGQSAKLLSIELLNLDEWQNKNKEYFLLEKNDRLVFVYKKFAGGGLPKSERQEYLILSSKLDSVLKSFKSQKQ